jgi:hypothetical protein
LAVLPVLAGGPGGAGSARRAYTLHRIPFIIEVPEATTPAGRGIVVRSEKQVIARELGRDYLPARPRITRDQTDLAA